MKMQKALHLHLELAKKNPKCNEQMYSVFEKYDGWFGTLDVVHGEAGYIRSSTGRLIPSLSGLSMKLQDTLSQYPFLTGRFIFEILSHDYKDFHTLNGVLNRKSEQCPNAYLMVHDLVITPDDAFSARYKEMKRLVTEMAMYEVRVAPVLITTSNIVAMQTEARSIWSSGGEGVILKRTAAPYSEGKRNCDLMKIKEECTKDLLVTGVVAGQGKYSNTVGALLLKNKAGHTFTVSGMSDDERDEWWHTPEKIIGQIVEVKAMKELPDGSLREPRFKAIRWNKAAGDFD